MQLLQNIIIQPNNPGKVHRMAVTAPTTELQSQSQSQSKATHRRKQELKKKKIPKEESRLMEFKAGKITKLENDETK